MDLLRLFQKYFSTLKPICIYFTRYSHRIQAINSKYFAFFRESRKKWEESNLILVLWGKNGAQLATLLLFRGQVCLFVLVTLRLVPGSRERERGRGLQIWWAGYYDDDDSGARSPPSLAFLLFLHIIMAINQTAPHFWAFFALTAMGSPQAKTPRALSQK